MSTSAEGGQLRHYKKVFYAAYGFGPYECFFCRERTVPFDDRNAHVHHIDGDKKNNHPYNLAGAHNTCHKRWHALNDGHQKGPTKPQSPEHVARRMASRWTPEAKAKAAQSIVRDADTGRIVRSGR